MDDKHELELSYVYILPDGQTSHEMIQVPFDTRIGFLKQTVGESLGYGQKPMPCSVYKIDIPLEDENGDTLEIPHGQLKRGAKLLLYHKLSEIFPSQPPIDRLHLLFDIVPTPSKAQHRSRPSVPPTSFRWRPQPEISNERSDFVRAFDSHAEIPSTRGRTPEFSSVQEDPQRSFRWSRPATATPLLPPTLLSNHLRQFKEDAETIIPEPWAFKLVTELQSNLSGLGKEEHRKNKVRSLLQDAGFMVTPGEVPGLKDKNYTDGDFRVGGLPIEIWELKEDFGWSGAEPWCQSLLHYYHLTKVHAVQHPSLSLPCLLNVLVGAQISFSGVVWDQRPNVQVLTPTFPLFFHSSDNEARTRLARAFTAYKKARQNLAKHYEKVRHDLPSSASLFPDQTSIKSKSGDLIQFEYTAQSPDRRVFRAKSTSPSNRSLVVKFTPEGYSPEVHTFCARSGFAPALLGHQKLPSGWDMVVMEDLNETYDPFDLDAVDSEDKDQLKSHFQSLHRAGFVHGDIRSSNILMRKTSVRNGSKFMVFDFDWSGEVGQVYYPSEINCGIRRPNNVVGLAPITIADDEWMLDEVLRNGHD